MEMSKKRF